jgi:sugar phosphate isomerase/epimerase
MIFDIDRASDPIASTNPPHYKAKNLGKKNTRNDIIWQIEINSLEELIELAKEEGIIIKNWKKVYNHETKEVVDDGEISITIYDSYVE